MENLENKNVNVEEVSSAANEAVETVDPETVKYMNGTHKWGRILGLVIFALIFFSPFVVALVFQALPNWKALGEGILAVLPMYWAVGLVEIFTYTPMLGAGGTYVAFVTGNISNLKLPCALDALERSGYKATSEEGEIISTIAITVSSIVTTLIILIGVCLIVPLSPILESETLSAAFNQILPALFGGLAVVFISKNWKIAIAPVILMIVLFVAVPALNSSTVGIMVPVGVVFTIAVSRILYKKNLL